MDQGGRFEIKKWHPVAYWTWSLKVEHCAICKNHIMEACIQCEGQGTDCPIQHGKCSHSYHEHCINNWIKQKNTCPLDNRVWERDDKR